MAHYKSISEKGKWIVHLPGHRVGCVVSNSVRKYEAQFGPDGPVELVFRAHTRSATQDEIDVVQGRA